ncbi:glycosyltransferase family protein [Corynebacterium cystitidis]|uniref:glycosyltransferase family protein n=1 Tax=Corynebacterium cystitidis TaxID=35757 RepID=UPI00211F3BE7|nr:glycosyltransferase [Corynebacterium cystitidis]
MKFTDAWKARGRACYRKVRQFGAKYLPVPLKKGLKKLIGCTPRVSPKGPTSPEFPELQTIHQRDHPFTPRFPKFTAGTILDRFSHTCWSSEFNFVPVNPNTWKENLADIDFLFVESAWEGNNKAWQYQLTGSRAPTQELRDLIKECYRRKIPTVFWNKEDPTHFHDFLETARLFDYVFTTDEDTITEYRAELGHQSIFTLPFAAQPAVHNPARNRINYAVNDVAFAGTYFSHKFPERKVQMDLILGAAVKGAEEGRFSFDIFSRHAGGEDKYQFPKPFSRYVRGALPYSQMLTAYRSYKAFLNVNSVVDSPSMCARRIFEISASGTPVVTTRSKAVPQFFPQDEVPVVDNSEEALSYMRALVNSPELRERMVHKAQRRIWENHTYQHRARTILRTIGLDDEAKEAPLVSVICSTNRKKNIAHLIKQVTQQNYPRIELVVLGHGIDISNAKDYLAEESPVENVTILHTPSEEFLGNCLNNLVNHSTGSIIAKFDDDDYYMPNYLRDQVNILTSLDADLVGKSSIYFYLEATDAIVRRWPQTEHTWREFVAGATFVGKRKTFTETPFLALERGEDTRFLKDLADKGKRVYSSDRFNYMATRSTNTHTWKISDLDVLAYSQLETHGLNLSHITV